MSTDTLPPARCQAWSMEADGECRAPTLRALRSTPRLSLLDPPYFSVELLADNSSALAGNFRE